MPKRVIPLTVTQIKAAKPRDKEYSITDGDGLSLRIRPSGSNVWLFNYLHPITKKRSNLSFGHFPEVSLARARDLRKDARELIAQNISPLEHRTDEMIEKRSALCNTLEKVVTQWLVIKRSKVSDDHADDIYRSLEKHIFPRLGQTAITDITAPRTIEVINRISAGGSLETVKRLCQRLNEVMVYATNTGLIHHNPLAGIRDAFQTPKKQHLPTLKPEELPELMKALSRASIKLQTRCLMEWQLHTMVRPSEAAGATWEEIDFENDLWHIPAERMKRKRHHSVPLTTQTLSILEEMKPISDHRVHIFPGINNPKISMNSSTANMALKRMNFGGRLVAHGFRSIASTTLNEKGFEPDVIESALAHVIGNEVRAAYNRAEYLEQRHIMMNWWSKHIEEAASVNSIVSRNTDNITKLRNKI